VAPAFACCAAAGGLGSLFCLLGAASWRREAKSEVAVCGVVEAGSKQRKGSHAATSSAPSQAPPGAA